MKRAAIAAILLLLAAPAWGASLGGMVSYWSTDEADDDTGLGLKLDLDLGSRLDFEVRAAFFDSLQFPDNNPVFEIEATTVDVGLGYNFRGRRATPYVGGGLSYVLLNTDIRPMPGDGDRGRLKDEVGWYGVLGVEAPLGPRLQFFVEALFRQAKAEIQGEGLAAFDNVDVDFSGAGASVGIQLAW